MKFTGEFTHSTFKRVFKNNEQVGLMIDMHLRKDKPHLEKLSIQEIQMIFRRNEKTIMNLVPNKLELQLMGDPDNRAYMLRPEARFNCGS